MNISQISSLIGNKRMRRRRQSEWSRRLMRETRLTTDDLIWPIFLVDGKNIVEPIETMPGINRLSVDKAIEATITAAQLGIPAVLPFPYTDPKKRDETGSEALKEDNLVCRFCRAIKQHDLPVGIITDAALDPYTSHGHDGIIEGSEILNDETVALLVQQSILQAKSGADVISPSDMMDGRVAAIRHGLDKAGFQNVQIMSYSSKYASAVYAPFREAIGTQTALIGDKKTYQMDPANSDEALHETALDIQEGADMVMVKPGIFYLDILSKIKQEFSYPTFVYQVSGEYAMIAAAGQNGWIDEKKIMMESLIAFKRAGADGILTYFAPQAARILNESNS